jgi:DNA (cytosine-5)-methyltransferase 1
MQTITAKADSCVAQPVLAPFVARWRMANTKLLRQAARPVDQPFGPSTTAATTRAIDAHLAPFVADQSRP